jgi:hypothetical protein
MSPAEPIVVALFELTKAFEGCVTWTTWAILETLSEVKVPFKVVHSAPEPASLYALLSADGSDFNALLIMAVEETDLVNIVAGENDPKLRKDAFGEMSNVISGVFLANDQFISKFGNLKPSVPAFSDGGFSSRKEWGLVGTVNVNGRPIHLHFFIRPNRSIAEVEPIQSESKKEGKPE